MVYKSYVTVDGGYILQPQSNKLRCADGSPCDMAFMLTCKRVTKEMRGVHLASNTITASTYLPDNEHQRVQARYHNQLTEILHWRLAAFLEQLPAGCLHNKHEIASKFPAFSPVLDAIEDGSLRDNELLRPWSWHHTGSVMHDFMRFTWDTLPKTKTELYNKHILDHNIDSIYAQVPRLENLLDCLPPPWTIITPSHFVRMSGIIPPGMYAGEHVDCYSATAIAIRFLQSLSRESRQAIRSLLLNEDQRGVAATQRHGLGLIPYCHENPRLRIERRVDFLGVIWPFTDSSRSHHMSWRLETWISEALALESAGMPPGCFTLVLTGPPSCTNVFQAVIMRHAAWQMAMYEQSRQGRLPPLSWTRRRRTYLDNDAPVFDPWCLSENFPQAVRDIANGSSIIRCNFDTGKFWDVNQLVESNNMAQWSLQEWRSNWKRRHNINIVTEN